MNETYRQGTKLWDNYFGCVVEVLATFVDRQSQFKHGRYYKVKYPNGPIMDSHETAFSQPWYRQRDKKGKFLNFAHNKEGE